MKSHIPRKTRDRVKIYPRKEFITKLRRLPESLATMAIVPLRTKVVYHVGRNYGDELGRGHVKEVLAAAGVGLTSEVLEGYARKLLSGLLGKAGGRKLASIELRQSFSSLTEQGRALQGRYASDIQQKAGTLKVSPLLPVIRGRQ